MNIVEMQSLKRFLTEDEAMKLFCDVKSGGTIEDMWALYMRTPRVPKLRKEMECAIEDMAIDLLKNASTQEERWRAARYTLFAGKAHAEILEEIFNYASSINEYWDVLKSSYFNKPLFDKAVKAIRNMTA